MKTLVVGGAGYIGSVVTRLLLAEGHEVVVLDDCSTGHADAVPDGRRTHPGGHHHASRGIWRATDSTPCCTSRRNPWSANRSSTRRCTGGRMSTAPGRCSTPSPSTACPRLVFSSTAATYGEPETVPITEDAPTRPTNTYGATKLAVDMMITGECAATDLAAVSLRYFNVAGAAYGAGERHRTETHLIPIALDAVAGRRGAADASSATTGRPPTAPRSATTSTSRTSPGRTCWP